MLGWNILFALMTVPWGAATIFGHTAGTSIKTTGVVFSFLLLTSLLTWALRDRAR